MNYTFILTGATGGIGKKILEKLVRLGHYVIATDIDRSKLENLKIEFKEFNSSFETDILDVRKSELWEKIIIDATKKKFKFYGLIHSAGVLLPSYIKDIKNSDIDFHIDINLKGTILGSKIASKYLIENKEGHIFHIASLAAISPVPGIALYSCSKFAVRGFSLSLSMELEPKNVFVTCICPDAVDTPMLELQKDYEEAALTFSGSKALTVDEVSDAVISSIGKNIYEIVLPKSRGIQAKLASMFPQITGKFLKFYISKGLKFQRKYSKNKN